MKIYKKDLRRFIESNEEKVISSIIEKHNKSIKDSRIKMALNYDNELKDMKKVLTEAQEKISKIIARQKSCVNAIRCNESIEEALDYFEEFINYDIKDVELEERENKEANKEVIATKLEYIKIKNYIKNNSAENSYYYLKEIGFDITSIPTYVGNKSEFSVLKEKVDTSKLFILGNN